MVFAGSGAAGALGAAATAAGTGAVGEGREPRVSKPVSRRSFWTGAGAKAGARAGARAGAVVGARVGDIRPEKDKRQDQQNHVYLVFSSTSCNCKILPRHSSIAVK